MKEVKERRRERCWEEGEGETQGRGKEEERKGRRRKSEGIRDAGQEGEMRM